MKLLKENKKEQKNWLKRKILKNLKEYKLKQA